MTIENKIIEYLNLYGEAGVTEMQEHLNVSRQMLHRVLNRMLEEGILQKLGKPPKVFYRLSPLSARRKATMLSLPEDEIHFLNLIKVTGAIPIPQKALSKIEDRIDNARASIVAKETRPFNHVLLIDDAVGSGATINETAAKLKLKKIAKKVFGLAITGSFKGFDVIQEV